MFQMLHVFPYKGKIIKEKTQEISSASANSLSYMVLRELTQNVAKSMHSLFAAQFFIKKKKKVIIISSKQAWNQADVEHNLPNLC